MDGCAKEGRPKRLKAQWLESLSGRRKSPVGDWQLQIVLAERHNWTPEQVAALPAPFVDELLIYYEASATHAERERKKAERESKAQKHR